MASISGVTLQVAPAPFAWLVTVKATLGFDANDVGKTFQLSIALWGEDLPTDKLPAGDTTAPDELYSFKWGSVFFSTNKKAIPVSAAGTVPVNETRTVSDSVLDEDTGVVAPQNVPPLPGVPRKDEVFAVVSLSTTVTEKSATVPVGIGV